MYVLFISLLFIQPNKDPPIVPITRSIVQYYLTEDACHVDTNHQIAEMVKGIGKDPDYTTSYCVKITGPAGVGV